MPNEKHAIEGGSHHISKPIRDGWQLITDAERQAAMELMDRGVVTVGAVGVVGDLAP